MELRYSSQLHQSPLDNILGRNRDRDLLLQRTSGGVHKDDIESVEDVEEAVMPYMEIPYNSVKHWGEYLTGLSDLAKPRPYYSVLTKMAFDDDVTYPSPTFEMERRLDTDIKDAVKERQEEAIEMLMTPFSPQDTSDDDKDDEKPKKKKKKVVEEEEDDDEEERDGDPEGEEAGEGRGQSPHSGGNRDGDGERVVHDQRCGGDQAGTRPEVVT